jgi:hypothetical protein
MSERGQQTSRNIPWAAGTACLSLLAGAGLAVGGVYELAGPGWALVAGAAMCFAFGVLILRGLS